MKPALATVTRTVPVIACDGAAVPTATASVAQVIQLPQRLLITRSSPSDAEAERNTSGLIEINECAFRSKPEKLSVSKCFPLCPRKRTLRYALGMSVSCQ